MSLKYRDVTGKETPIAGLNGLSGELVPSVSYYQSGTVTVPAIAADGYQTATVTFSSAMPDTDYVVVAGYTETGGYRAFAIVNGLDKTTTGCTITAHNTASATIEAGTIAWQAFKLMTDESRALDEAAIATNTADIAALKSSVNDTAVYTLPTSAYNSDELTVTTSDIKIQSCGKIRIIEGGGAPFKTTGAKNNVTVLTLPSGYRPKYKTELIAMCTGGTVGAGVLRCLVETSGIVRVWTGDTQCGGNLFISGTYIAAD